MAYVFFLTDNNNSTITFRVSNGTTPVFRGGTFHYGATPAYGNQGLMNVSDLLFYQMGDVALADPTGMFFKAVIGGDDSGARFVSGDNFSDVTEDLSYNQMDLAWNTTQSGVATISYGPSGGPYTEVSGVATGSSAVFSITGLTPETGYQYRLGLIVDEGSNEFTISGTLVEFLTPAEPVLPEQQDPRIPPIGSFAPENNASVGTDQFGNGVNLNSPNYISPDNFMDNILR